MWIFIRRNGAVVFGSLNTAQYFLHAICIIKRYKFHLKISCWHSIDKKSSKKNSRRSLSLSNENYLVPRRIQTGWRKVTTSKERLLRWERKSKTTSQQRDRNLASNGDTQEAAEGEPRSEGKPPPREVRCDPNLR